MPTATRQKRARMCKKRVVVLDEDDDEDEEQQQQQQQEEEEEEEVRPARRRTPAAARDPYPPPSLPRTVTLPPLGRQATSAAPALASVACKPAAASATSASASQQQDEAICVICQDDVGTEDNVVAMKCCQALFHADCLAQCLHAGKRECCVCKTIYPGGLEGDCPQGEMRWSLQASGAIAGFPARSGVITIEYDLPSGTQSGAHPSPGQRYTGTHRLAYLPNTQEGQRVLGLLQRAFAARLVFTIGTSLTTGASNQVVWAGIHHKTVVQGGAFGYPDATYLERVQDELRLKGIV